MLLVALLVVLEASGLLIGQMPIKEILRPSIFSGETVDSLECIYQASKDGWDASTFHKLVDYNPPVPSLVLLKTNKGKLGARCTLHCAQTQQHDWPWGRQILRLPVSELEHE